MQCDELWSFVDNKGNKQWVWLALDADTREIVGVYIGTRDEAAARQLWASLPPNRLTLCTMDTCLLTAEGTEQLRQTEIVRLTKKLPAVQNPEALTESQQVSLKRQHSTLARLQNPPQRHSKPLYQGDLEIMLGISIGLAHPATATVVNIRTGKVLVYRSTRQLLGKNYRLLNRQRQKQQLHALQRHKNQIKGRTSQLSESELGQYVDRLLAKSIIELAQQFQASCIVLPHTNHLREYLAAEINARAEQKSDSKEVQNKYAKQFRISIHRWSYDRLLATRQKKLEFRLKLALNRFGEHLKRKHKI